MSTVAERQALVIGSCSSHDRLRCVVENGHVIEVHRDASREHRESTTLVTSRVRLDEDVGEIRVRTVADQENAASIVLGLVVQDVDARQVQRSSGAFLENSPAASIIPPLLAVLIGILIDHIVGDRGTNCVRRERHDSAGLVENTTATAVGSVVLDDHVLEGNGSLVVVDSARNSIKIVCQGRVLATVGRVVGRVVGNRDEIPRHRAVVAETATVQGGGTVAIDQDIA